MHKGNSKSCFKAAPQKTWVTWMITMFGSKTRNLHKDHPVERRPPDHTQENPSWIRQDAAERRKYNNLTRAALWFARHEMAVAWAVAAATRQVRPVQRGPTGPYELRLHLLSLQGGLLIACSTPNWFSARSQPEWQRVKEGISCFCIYNSVASCVWDSVELFRNIY